MGATLLEKFAAKYPNANSHEQIAAILAGLPDAPEGYQVLTPDHIDALPKGGALTAVFYDDLNLDGTAAFTAGSSYELSRTTSEAYNYMGRAVTVIDDDGDECAIGWIALARFAVLAGGDE